MTQKEYLKEFENITKSMLEINTAKNSDYSGGGTNNEYKNFKIIEELTNGDISVEEGILVRLTDKISRIASLIKGQANKVNDEKITDTLQDLANYSIILLIYLKNKNK